MPSNGALVQIGKPLVPLRRMGPSRFAAWRSCKLREAFRVVVTDAILPRSPAAHLGSVIHRLIEEAGQGPSLCAEEADSLFHTLLAREEEHMFSSIVDRTGLPLSRSVRDFEVRRKRAIRAAVLASATSTSVQGSGGVRTTGSEVWIETTDHLVGGFVDEIANTNGRIIIRDFKTGLAARRGTPEQLEAFLQLKLYAAIYAEAVGTWPEILQIVPLQGEPTAMEVNRDECVALLAEARLLISETNAIITSEPQEVSLSTLARPSANTCQYCEFRPLCPPYLASARSDEGWPRDVIGVMGRRIQLKNGTLLLELTDASGETIRVRGISTEPGRHPGLPLVVPGCRVGIFNVLGKAGEASFTEGPATTIVLPA